MTQSEDCRATDSRNLDNTVTAVIASTNSRRSHYHRSGSQGSQGSQGSAHFSDYSSKVSATSEMVGAPLQKGSLFLDASEIKQRVRESLQKPTYNVHDLYWDTGIFATIGRSAVFEKITLIVIAFNAIWIAIDTDLNEEEVLTKADAVFQIAEHFFCAFFLCEWIIRFASFKNKFDGLRDAWFVFDSCLVLMIVLETWVLTIVLAIVTKQAEGPSGGLKNTSILRVARVLRLTRMARMARLLRAMPELMILVKGLAAAMRSVFFALCLLLVIVFVFAIAFTQLTVDFDFHKEYFDHVLHSMYTLLFRGALLDNASFLINEIGERSLPLAGLFSAFVLISALTVMNMLIGVLVEVVSSVAKMENEEAMLAFVRSKIEPLVREIDTDGNCEISREEFVKLVENQTAIQTLHDVGVDAIGLVDYADFIFSDDVTGDELPDLSFSDFMEVVLQLRGSNSATVKDIVDLRKFIAGSFKHFEAKLDTLIARRLRHQTSNLAFSMTGSIPLYGSPGNLAKEHGRLGVSPTESEASPKSPKRHLSMSRADTLQSVDSPKTPHTTRSRANTMEFTAIGKQPSNSSTQVLQEEHGNGHTEKVDSAAFTKIPLDNSMRSVLEELEKSLEGHARHLDTIMESVCPDSLSFKVMGAPQTVSPSSKTSAAKSVHGASRGLQTSRVDLGHDLHRTQLSEHVDACAEWISSLQETLDSLGDSLNRSPHRFG